MKPRRGLSPLLLAVILGGAGCREAPDVSALAGSAAELRARRGCGGVAPEARDPPL